jgi:hypothetical protein
VEMMAERGLALAHTTEGQPTLKTGFSVSGLTSFVITSKNFANLCWVSFLPLNKNVC